MSKRLFKVFAIVIIVTAAATIILSFREMTHKNEGQTIKKGKWYNGSQENAWLMPYSGNNFKYFSFLSYYIADNAYVNDKVCRAVTGAYKICEKTAPGVMFRHMEGSNYGGGSMWWHRTHRNGTSIDFMIPKIKDGKQFTSLDDLANLHYFLDFDNNGNFKNARYIPIFSGIVERIGKGCKLDFESAAAHILALDDACRKEGISIRKVIIKLEYKNKIFSTPSGKEILKRKIPFATKISKATNAAHDEHYHIDFKI